MSLNRHLRLHGRWHSPQVAPAAQLSLVLPACQAKDGVKQFLCNQYNTGEWDKTIVLTINFV